MGKGKITRKEQAILTRTKIYDNAVALFKDKKMEDVKIEEICESAGVSVGTFYHYFENKESIVKEGFRRFDRVFEDKIKGVEIDDPIEMIRFSIENYISRIDEIGLLYAGVLLEYELFIEDNYLQGKDRSLYKYIKNSLNIAKKRNIIIGDTEIITRYFLKMIRGTVFYWIVNKNSYGLLEDSKEIVEIVLGSFLVKQ